ncbi:MAG: LysR substrate-binding domain-containing protein [Hyphomonadaceae bacterium]
MTLEQLRIFIAVAEREHVTRAAEALNLTQSAVSAAVAALETRYGVALFHRVGRSIELSQEGRAFLGEARAVLERAEAAERALIDMSGLKRGSLRIRASQTIASYWLPPRLASFRRAFPQIDLAVSVGNTQQAAQAVSSGAAELAFVEGRIDDPDLELSEVDHDRLIVVVAPGHPWAKKSRLTAKDLAAGEWVLRETGSGTRSEFEAALTAAGVDPQALNVVLELPSNEAVRVAVEGGAGVGALSDLAAAPGLETGALARARFAMSQRTFHALRHRGRYQSRAAQAFLGHCLGEQETR